MNTAPLKAEWWQTLSRVDCGRGPLDVFRDFVTLAACTLHSPTRETEYHQALAPYVASEDRFLFPLAFGQLMHERLHAPFVDTLGPVYMLLASTYRKQDLGAFYTPQHVSDLMAEMTVPGSLAEHPADQPFLIQEPAVGSGGMLLSAARVAERYGALDRLVCEAWDVDFLATQMAVVNLSLAGVRGLVVHGDSLKQTRHAEWYTNTGFMSTAMSVLRAM